MGHQVVVYLYDVTRGMARTMSPMLLGQQIDGVWHTGLMVFGQEYFFGGDGVASCLPSGTILGEPTEKIPMGETQIPQEIFHEYLTDLANSTFRGSSYHLLDHNCNTFTNEVCQFLTGKAIPAYITDLPNQFINTSFGQMVKPFIDQMMTSVQNSTAGGTHFGSSSDDVPSTDTASTGASSNPSRRGHGTNPTNQRAPSPNASGSSTNQRGRTKNDLSNSKTGADAANRTATTRTNSKSPTGKSSEGRGAPRRTGGASGGSEVNPTLAAIDFKSIIVPKLASTSGTDVEKESDSSSENKGFQQNSNPTTGSSCHDLELD